MKNMIIEEGRHLESTPAGAFFMSSSPKAEPARRLLLNIMSSNSSPNWNPLRLAEWSGLEQKQALELLYQLQKLGWVSDLSQAQKAPEGPLEEVLPSLLEHISVDSKALLADNQGFYLGTNGIPHEAAEALSAVSADLGSLFERHERLLVNNLGRREQAWSLSDAAGNSQLGFWPLYIGSLRFVLVVEGRPTFNQPAFRDLVWTLTLRYSAENLWENKTEYA
ncbi:MAG: hypothetical protein P8179_11715 [Candidatus Thiodiazotropha sp.]|jgi:hypothetical protein